MHLGARYAQIQVCGCVSHEHGGVGGVCRGSHEVCNCLRKANGPDNLKAKPQSLSCIDDETSAWVLGQCLGWDDDGFDKPHNTSG